VVEEAEAKDRSCFNGSGEAGRDGARMRTPGLMPAKASPVSLSVGGGKSRSDLAWSVGKPSRIMYLSLTC
jgi:hypothetical protein